MNSTYKNILVVNVNWVGDVIFSSPIFKALKAVYPKAHVACLAVPRVKEILECIPAIDEIIVYDEKGKDRGPLAKGRLVRTLKNKHFDAAFLLHRSWTRALLVFLAGIPTRVGYDAKGRGFLLTHIVKAQSLPAHRSEIYLRVIESLGVEVKDRGSTLSVPQETSDYVETLLKGNGVSPSDFVIIVNPGGNWDLKRWPKEYFISLIQKLTQEKNVKIVIPGAKKDVALAQEIAALSKSGAVVLADKTDTKQLAALLKRANLVISADSGPLHIANSVGTPAIGLYGPTRPEITGPRGRGRFSVLQNDVGCNRSPCYYLDCPDNVCMKSISVEQVLNEIRRVKS